MKMVNFEKTKNVILGDKAVLVCNVLFGTSAISDVTWARNGSLYTPLTEDPFCNDPNVSTNGVIILKNNLAFV